TRSTSSDAGLGPGSGNRCSWRRRSSRPGSPMPRAWPWAGYAGCATEEVLRWSTDRSGSEHLGIGRRAGFARTGTGRTARHVHPPVARLARPRPARALALQGAAVLPRLARHQGPLQADGAGRELGHHPAVLHHGRLQPLLRTARRRSVRWRAVLHLQLRRTGAVDLLRERAHALGEQCGRQSAALDEGLFPPARDSPGHRARRCGRLRPRLRRPARDDALLRHRAHHERRLDRAAARARPDHGSRRRALVRPAQRTVPRRPLCRALPGAGLALRDARRLRGIAARQSGRALAGALFAEPDGRRGRGLPLGAARYGHGAGSHGSRVVARRGADPGGRGVLFPAHGADLRRCGVRAMSEIVIRAEGLGKQYRIGEAQARNDTLRDALAASVGRAWRGLRRLSRPSRRERFWALRDVSFELARGEILGNIGHNGAGKSTLLKILSRITEPTSGEVMIRGRVGSLLEVGTGFHSELTGRENIYLNGAILGMTRAEIDRKFDEIVAFAGIDRFIDTPVKHYSSGMDLRLGCSVAAHLEPEILLVDEILAVGDAEFQKKCLGRMNEGAREGRTVIFVSHNLDAIQRLCTRCMMLDGGQVAAYGPTADVVAAYLSRGRGPVDAGERVDLSSANRQGGSGVRFLSAVFGSGSAEAAN